jgi:hypothetical protein
LEQDHPGSPTLSIEATQLAFARHTVHRAGERLTPDDWAALADQFAEDAVYEDSFHGRFEGRPAIRDFLYRSAVGLEEWRFDIAWTAVDAGKVVVHLDNRPPGRRADGSG